VCRIIGLVTVIAECLIGVLVGMLDGVAWALVIGSAIGVLGQMLDGVIVAASLGRTLVSEMEEMVGRTLVGEMEEMVDRIRDEKLLRFMASRRGHRLPHSIVGQGIRGLVG
jgi:hypothetical protein